MAIAVKFLSNAFSLIFGFKASSAEAFKNAAFIYLINNLLTFF